MPPLGRSGEIGRSGRSGEIIKKFKFLTDNAMKLIEKKDVNTNTKVRLCQTVEIGRSGRTRSRFVNHVILVNDFVNTSKTSAKTNTKV